MSRIDEWVRRVRIMGKAKSHEEVEAFDRKVVMTTTQAWRFRELQAGGFPAHPPTPPPAADKAWYDLDEACARLGCAADDLLAAAADGRLVCYVEAGGLRGNWEGRDDAPAAPPSHLALTPASCGEIARYGSANVCLFECREGGTVRQFRPVEIQWIDRRRLLFAHPLAQGREPARS